MMTMLGRRSGWIAIVAVLVVLLAATAEAAIQPLTLESARGAVEVRVGGGDRWTTAHERMPINPGDMIRTGANSRALLRHSRGNTVALSENAVVIVGASRVREAGSLVGGTSEYRVELIHLRGRVDHLLTRYTVHRSSYRVTTPIAIAAVRGTEFTSDVQWEADASRKLDEILNTPEPPPSPAGPGTPGNVPVIVPGGIFGQLFPDPGQASLFDFPANDPSLGSSPDNALTPTGPPHALNPSGTGSDLGGPIVGDRLWFFGPRPGSQYDLGGRETRNSTNFYRDPLDHRAIFSPPSSNLFGTPPPLRTTPEEVPGLEADAEAAAWRREQALRQSEINQDDFYEREGLVTPAKTMMRMLDLVEKLRQERGQQVGTVGFGVSDGNVFVTPFGGNGTALGPGQIIQINIGPGSAPAPFRIFGPGERAGNGSFRDAVDLQRSNEELNRSINDLFAPPDVGFRTGDRSTSQLRTFTVGINNLSSLSSSFSSWASLIFSGNVSSIRSAATAFDSFHQFPSGISWINFTPIEFQQIR